jgi:hypothetical protein
MASAFDDEVQGCNSSNKSFSISEAVDVAAFSESQN